MTNVQWRIMRGRARILIEEMLGYDLPKEFINELDRILELLDQKNYIDSTPKIFYEAPQLNLDSLHKEIKEKYTILMNEAERFKP